MNDLVKRCIRVLKGEPPLYPAEVEEPGEVGSAVRTKPHRAAVRTKAFAGTVRRADPASCDLVEEVMMTQFLVTGGTEFIGSHLATRLVPDEQHMHVLDNLDGRTCRNLNHRAGHVEVLRGDLYNPDGRKACEGVEIVFHQAALASVPRRWWPPPPPWPRLVAVHLLGSVGLA